MKGTDRLRPQPQQRPVSQREEKLHAKRLKRERKAEQKLHPARPEQPKRARNERSARRHSAATPTPKPPRKAKRERGPMPVAAATPSPPLRPTPPKVDSEAQAKSHR